MKSSGTYTCEDKEIIKDGKTYFIQFDIEWDYYEEAETRDNPFSSEFNTHEITNVSGSDFTEDEIIITDQKFLIELAEEWVDDNIDEIVKEALADYERYND